MSIITAEGRAVLWLVVAFVAGAGLAFVLSSPLRIPLIDVGALLDDGELPDPAQLAAALEAAAAGSAAEMHAMARLQAAQAALDQRPETRRKATQTAQKFTD